MKAWFLALTLVAVALAGCNDPEPKQEIVGPGIKVDDKTGVIHGVVVDEGFRPIAGVQVTAISGEGAPVDGKTGPDGLFAFGPIAPGSYILRAEKAGFVSGQTSTEVQAGVKDPKSVRIALILDPETRPYATTSKVSGFIECSVRAYDATGATTPVFGEPFYAGFNVCSTAGGVGNQQTEFPVEFDAPPTYVQGELQWSSSQATGSGLTLVAGPASCIDVKWGRADGESPLVVGLNQTVFEENRDDGSGEGTCFRVFSWVAPETGNFLGAALSQEFELFLTTFYNFVPDDGWTFIADGEAEPPQ